MKRSELKALVKECLVEILSEGIGNISSARDDLQTAKFESRSTPSRAIQARAPKVEQHHRQVIKEIVGNATTDPTLASIFAETAATTLKKQADAERNQVVAPPGSDRAQLAVAEHAPEEIFGEAAGKWAALAFMDQPKR